MLENLQLININKTVIIAINKDCYQELDDG